MRLIKHEGVTGMPPVYTITGVSVSDLAYLQLFLIGNGQPELRVGEDWAAKETQQGRQIMNAKCNVCGSMAVYYDSIRKVIRCHVCAAEAAHGNQPHAQIGPENGGNANNG